mmetsp:Transcript_33368/g.55999  ORF Transcript_33368/g.55999 Transcript_33368/m.55999 type:complete len:544 (+) Transcript_33368:310-1941(+)|eukprot:CAMPEP_0198198498 /NCGR_PEP_ID=MMETSP1445-20131203/1968_1 /TAXON_ID=36898 /ORGANISM="Pyramimonas sp., Strain CCMP2087" /LENGTH=543 /DNA_ID=CAMNT_0043868085 /DNA_START=310 /DNA_END=1941 /DNA_ORIENTATION=+
MLRASLTHLLRPLKNLERPLNLNLKFSAPFSTAFSFKDVSFSYDGTHDLLSEINFSVRSGAKVTLMGQNGSGKSTILKLLNNELVNDTGRVNITSGQTVATAKQTMPQACRDMTVLNYFSAQFTSGFLHPGAKALEHEVSLALRKVDLVVPDLERQIKSFSGGQQARLLLAAALILNPSILLLDEPTNNLDTPGIDHLREVIVGTDSTVLVISHDEDFLNSFTDSVLYLDVHNKRVEVYDGDYWFVKEEIAKRIEKENRDNSRLAKEAQKKKDQAGKFANKGGGLRKVAQTMRKVAEELESQVVDVRREDTALKSFSFPFRKPDAGGWLINISALQHRCPSDGNMMSSELARPIQLSKGDRLHIKGPNGIGKTTFLEVLTKGNAKDTVTINKGATVGYYRQDFNNFNFEDQVLEALKNSAEIGGGAIEPEIRKMAAFFMLRGKVVYQKIATLSEGQKALLSLACLMLEKPSILVFDEPTNHVNFRHLPSIAEAMSKYDGAVVVVSHDEQFMRDVNRSGINNVLDMGFELSEQKANKRQRVGVA